MSDYESVDKAVDDLVKEMETHDFDISLGEEKEARGNNKGRVIELIHNPSEKIFLVPLDIKFFNEEVEGVKGFDVMKAMLFENLWHQRHNKWPWEEDEDPRDEDLLHVYEKNPDLAGEN